MIDEKWVQNAREYESKIRYASVKSLANRKDIEQMRYLLRVALDMLESHLTTNAADTATPYDEEPMLDSDYASWHEGRLP